MILAAIGLAVASAVCAAVGTYMQHGSVGKVTSGGELSLRDVRKLFTDRTWLVGALAHAGTFWFQVAAISLAPLVVVQPLVVLSLPLVAILGVIGWQRHQSHSKRRLTPVAIGGIVATMVGLAMFIVLATQRAVKTTVSGSEAFTAGRFVVLVALVLVLAAALRSGRLRCLLLAVAAGSIHGLVSVLTRHISAVSQAHGVDAVPLMSILAVIVAFLIATWLVQKSYAHGPADLVVACITTTNPVVAIGIGMSVLGETAGAGASTTMWLAGCGALACAGIIALATSHSTVLSRDESDEQDVVLSRR